MNYSYFVNKHKKEEWLNTIENNKSLFKSDDNYQEFVDWINNVYSIVNKLKTTNNASKVRKYNYMLRMCDYLYPLIEEETLRFAFEKLTLDEVVKIWIDKNVKIRKKEKIQAILTQEIKANYEDAYQLLVKINKKSKHIDFLKEKISLKDRLITKNEKKKDDELLNDFFYQMNNNNLDDAETCIEKMKDSNNHIVKCFLGERVFVDYNLSLATAYFSAAADNGNYLAKYYLGLIYCLKKEDASYYNIESNYKIAFDYFNDILNNENSFYNDLKYNRYVVDLNNYYLNQVMIRLLNNEYYDLLKAEQIFEIVDEDVMFYKEIAGYIHMGKGNLQKACDYFRDSQEPYVEDSLKYCERIIKSNLNPEVLKLEKSNFHQEIDGFASQYLENNIMKTLVVQSPVSKKTKFNENKLSRIVRDGDAIKEKIEKTNYAIWMTTHREYSDAMASRLAAGILNYETEYYEFVDENKNTIKLLNELYRKEEQMIINQKKELDDKIDKFNKILECIIDPNHQKEYKYKYLKKLLERINDADYKNTIRKREMNCPNEITREYHDAVDLSDEIKQLLVLLEAYFYLENTYNGIDNSLYFDSYKDLFTELV